MNCFFVTDLHGDINKYNLLFQQIRSEKPDLVFIGGDLLAGGFLKSSMHNEDMIDKIIAGGLEKLRQDLDSAYPKVFIIMGNDDPKCEEKLLKKHHKAGLWQYINQKHVKYNGLDIFGYGWVPPSPFLNKDWERYDVSSYVDLGCVAPEDGYHTTKYNQNDVLYRTIKDDLEQLTKGCDLTKSIFLFHAPPYQTGLDRASLDGKMIDFAPLDVQVGSIAIKRFIEDRQPFITLHGHIHESYSHTGIWKERIHKSFCFSAVGLSSPLVLVKFNTNSPQTAQRYEIL
jgi:Icc-related predicted phosphoesterase